MTDKQFEELMMAVRYVTEVLDSIDSKLDIDFDGEDVVNGHTAPRLVRDDEKYYDPNHRDVDALLEAGTRAQREKLEENTDKGSWLNLNTSELFDLLSVEMRELADTFGMDDTEAMRREAADVANYAHMIIERCNWNQRGIAK